MADFIAPLTKNLASFVCSLQAGVQPTLDPSAPLYWSNVPAQGQLNW